MANNPPGLNAHDLMRLAREAGMPRPPCAQCAALVCPGWESVPGYFDTRRLQRLGSLRDASLQHEPTLDEYHPGNTRFASPDAPIETAHYPYNRCDLWACVGCRRLFLRFTEHAGYTQLDHIRELNPHLIEPARTEPL